MLQDKENQFWDELDEQGAGENVMGRGGGEVVGWCGGGGGRFYSPSNGQLGSCSSCSRDSK